MNQRLGDGPIGPPKKRAFYWQLVHFAQASDAGRAARLGKVTLVLPFGAFVDLGGVFGVLPASEFAAPGESREQVKARNEPGAPGPVVRGRGVRVNVVSVDLERERADLRLSKS